MLAFLEVEVVGYTWFSAHTVDNPLILFPCRCVSLSTLRQSGLFKKWCGPFMDRVWACFQQSERHSQENSLVYRNKNIQFL